MFDDALVESAKSHSLGGKRLSLPVALGLHLAVIAAFVGASAWFPGGPPEPAERSTLPIVFLPAASSSGPSEGARTRQTSHASRPPVHHEMTQPVSVPSDPSTKASSVLDGRPDSPQPDPSAGGDGGGGTEPGGGDGGSGGGDLGGGGNGDEILPVVGDVRAPVLLERVEPDYPESARRARLQGIVILEATITTSGEVQEVRVLKSVNPLLDEAAVRAVRVWRYRPATLNGRAVPVYLTVTVRFGIDG